MTGGLYNLLKNASSASICIFYDYQCNIRSPYLDIWNVFLNVFLHLTFNIINNKCY